MKCFYKSAITSSFRKMVRNHSKIPLLQACWEATRSVVPMESITIFHTAEHLSMVRLPRNDFLYCVVLIAIQILIVIDAGFKCVDVCSSGSSLACCHPSPQNPASGVQLPDSFNSFYLHWEALADCFAFFVLDATYSFPGSSFWLVSECHSSNKLLWFMRAWVIDLFTDLISCPYFVRTPKALFSGSLRWDHTCPAFMWLLGIQSQVLLLW